MMKTIELEEMRIGNYWSSNPEKWVSQFSADDFMNVYVNGSAGWYAIPLTEKWLTDFGFVKTDVGNWYSLPILNEWSQIQCNGVESFCEISVSKHSLLPRSCKYVHQLQNIYFALTGEELTLKPQPHDND